MSPRTPSRDRDRDRDRDRHSSSLSGDGSTSTTTTPPTATTATTAAAAAIAGAAGVSPISPPSPTITLSHVTATATATPTPNRTRIASSQPSNSQSSQSSQGIQGASRSGRGVMRRSPSDPVHPTSHRRREGYGRDAEAGQSSEGAEIARWSGEAGTMTEWERERLVAGDRQEERERGVSSVTLSREEGIASGRGGGPSIGTGSGSGSGSEGARARARSDMGTRRVPVHAHLHAYAQSHVNGQSHASNQLLPTSPSPSHQQPRTNPHIQAQNQTGPRQYRRHAASQPPPLSLASSHFFPFPSHPQHPSSSSSSTPGLPADPTHPHLPLPLSLALHDQQQQPIYGQQPIYVLSADGSSLFLLDPSKPPLEEQPPSYQSLNVQLASHPQANASVRERGVFGQENGSREGAGGGGRGGAGGSDDVFSAPPVSLGTGMIDSHHHHRQHLTRRESVEGSGSRSDVRVAGDGLRRVHSAVPVSHDAIAFAPPTSHAHAYEHAQEGNMYRARASTTSALRIRTHPSALSLSAASTDAPASGLASAAVSASTSRQRTYERPRNVHHTSSPPQTMRTIRTIVHPHPQPHTNTASDAGAVMGTGTGMSTGSSGHATRIRAHSSASTRYGHSHAYMSSTGPSYNHTTTGSGNSTVHSNRRTGMHRGQGQSQGQGQYGSIDSIPSGILHSGNGMPRASGQGDETTPLLGSAAARARGDRAGRERGAGGARAGEGRGRGLMREIWCGVLDPHEVEVLAAAERLTLIGMGGDGVVGRDAHEARCTVLVPAAEPGGVLRQTGSGEGTGPDAGPDTGPGAAVSHDAAHADAPSAMATVGADQEAEAASEAGVAAGAADAEAEARRTALADVGRINSWRAGWYRYWRPLGRSEYWPALLHLVLLNFPFRTGYAGQAPEDRGQALLVWPPLLVGTLAGTALLITLPIGAAVWWLTLIIARSAARLEIRMQMHHHAPAPSWLPPPTYHPIFHRVKEVIPVHVESGFGTGPVGVGGVGGGGCRSAPVSPSSPVSPMYGTLATSASVSAQGQGGRDGYFEQRGVGADTPSDNDEVGGQVGEVVWEKRFVKCSYAMFCDHYSYSALSYFLLVKPLITLFSTIVILALLPVAFATVVGAPVYMRAMRRWGRWQAGVAMENL